MADVLLNACSDDATLSQMTIVGSLKGMFYGPKKLLTNLFATPEERVLLTHEDTIGLAATTAVATAALDSYIVRNRVKRGKKRLWLWG